MSNPKIGPRLQQLLDQDESVPVEVTIKLVKETKEYFNDFPAARQLAQPARRNALRDIADAVAAYQSDLIAILDGEVLEPVRSIWINNVVGAHLKKASYVYTIVKRNEVRYVEITTKIPLQHVLDTQKIKPKPRKIGKPIKPAPPPKPTIIPTEPDESDWNVIDYSLTNTSEDWNIEIIGAPALWKEAGLTGKDVIIAVVDTGIDHEHLHLKDRMLDDGTSAHAHGYNSVDNSSDTMDIHGHGTSCAGILSGFYTGVAREATLMAIKALDVKDYCDTTTEQDELNLWAGIAFAVVNGCHLISMSVSIKHEDGPDYIAWREKSESLYEAGVMHVNSTGKLGSVVGKIDPNTGLPYIADIPHNIPAPANCPPPWLHPDQLALSKEPGKPNALVACGCCNIDYDLSIYSGQGPSDWDDFKFTKGVNSGLLKPDLVAPGVQVRTCALSGGILPMFSGTSAATPHIAGAVALLMQACLNAGLCKMPLDHILEALSSTSQQLNGQSAAGRLENGYGAGCINVYEAFKLGKANGWW